MPEINGTGAGETLEAGVSGTTIYAHGGDDTLLSGNSIDKLYGGDGNDLIKAGISDTGYGGAGADTLDGGDSSRLYGGIGDDTYIVRWDTPLSPGDTLYTASIYEEYGTETGGTDIIDLTNIVASRSNLEIRTEDGVRPGSVFDGESHTLDILDNSGNEIGVIFLEGTIEKYKIGNQIYSFPEYDNDNKSLSSQRGATNGDNNITGYTSSEPTFHTGLYGYDGNDTLKAGLQGDGYSQAIYGGRGDDLIQNGLTNKSGRYFGGEGNDTYRIEWSGKLPTSHYKLTIHEYAWAGSGDNDVLDLSNQVSNLNEIRFDDGLHNSLDVDVLDASGEKIGRINIRGSHDLPHLTNIEKIVTGAGVFEIPKGMTPEELEELRKETLAAVGRSEADMAKGERLEALKGGDTLNGFGGSDTIEGDSGDDVLVGGEGGDFIYGGGGKDTVWAGKGDDSGDLVVGGGGGDLLAGGPGNDSIEGDKGVLGVFSAGADTIFGGDGDDLLIGGGWMDRPDPGENNPFREDEVVSVSFDDNVIWGGSGDDSLYGTLGGEQLGGGTGNDVIKASSGNDSIYGGKGDGIDVIDAGDGNDIIFGGGGNDNLKAGDGKDTVYNGGGNDTVMGEAGADTLWGGPGNDRLTGGLGSDVFAFASGNGLDTVTDFTKGEDKLDLSAFAISDLASVAAAASHGGISGVTLTLDGSTEIFLQNLSLSDISNDMMI